MKAIDLPLHGGSCPKWLFNKMVDLGALISEYIINEFGKKEFLKRFSDTYWLQALGCVMGFDWHSSGLTTTTLAAIKEALERKNLEVQIAGGKGKYSLRTPEELMEKFDNDELIEYSRLIAKIDNNFVQDGFNLYLHFFISDGRDWTVVQQGLNDSNSYARRYHWSNLTNNEINNLSKLKTLLNPHSSLNLFNFIQEESLILTKNENLGIQKSILKLKDLSISEVKNTIKGLKSLIRDSINKQKSILDYIKNERVSIKKLPRRHIIKLYDLSDKDIKFFEAVKEFQPENYKELICLKGVGKKGIRALALMSSIIYGDEIDWKDFVKYSYAHGGKDKIPYPVDKTNYQRTISFLKEALDNSNIKNEEKRKALIRLNKLFFNSTKK